jgi:hypothetical protein
VPSQRPIYEGVKRRDHELRARGPITAFLGRWSSLSSSPLLTHAEMPESDHEPVVLFRQLVPLVNIPKTIRLFRSSSFLHIVTQFPPLPRSSLDYSFISPRWTTFPMATIIGSQRRISSSPQMTKSHHVASNQPLLARLACYGWQHTCYMQAVPFRDCLSWRASSAPLCRSVGGLAPDPQEWMLGLDITRVLAT